MQDNQREATLYAYLAGIMDGEGTIRINAAKSNQPNWNTRYNASVSLGMTDKGVIELFSKVFGSNVRTECVPSRKQMYRWGTSGSNKVKEILEKIYPYLRVKKDHAKIVINFCKKKKTVGFRRNKGIPTSELQWREDLYLKVKKLNATGAPATTKRKDTREGEAIV